MLFNNQRIAFIDKPQPQVNHQEVLIKPLMAGICSTDIELYRGYYGFAGVPGHEFVGIVEKSPGDPRLEGTRVVSEINIGCGGCHWCLAGEKRHCSVRRVIGIKEWDGAFAEYVRAPISNVYTVDETIYDEAAVFVEPLAAALQISQQVHITNAKRVVVLGDGKLGVLIALALRHYNPDILLVGKHGDKLNIAGEQGVKTFHAASAEELTNLREALGLFDVTIEATGSEEGFNHALDLVRPKGIIVVKTTSHNLSKIRLSKIVVDEITIVGSRCGDFELALAFLKNRWLDVLPLIEAIYEFTHFQDAFDHALCPGAKKILIRF